MTSCGDDTLPIATNHWPMMTTVDRNGASLSAVSVVAPDSRYGERENTALSTDPLLLVRQRMEMYWAQVLQFQQQRAMSAQMKDPKRTSDELLNGAPPKSLEEARSIMQRLIADKTDSYMGPMPLSSLAVMAANRQTGLDFSVRDLNGVESDLGNLLPPPPLIPMASQSLSTQRNTPSTSAVTGSTVLSSTSTFPLDLSKASDEPAAPAYAKDVSSNSDANQPLDLSASKKRPLPKDTPVSTHTPFMQCAPLQRSHQVAVTSINAVTSQPNSPPAYQHSILGAPAFAGFTQQQLSVLAPFLQSPRYGGLQVSGHSPNGQQYAASTLGNEYLHKWIHAAQQRQQAVQSQPPSKRRKLDEHARPNGSEAGVTFHRFVSPASEFMMNNNNSRVPTATSTVNHRQQQRQSQSHQGTGSRGGGKRYKRYAKPPYSYVSLITLAILSSPEKKLRLAQILKRIAEMFPFFNGSYQGWRDSVRHNLSQNECFVKVLKNPFRPTAKGNYWTVNVSAIAPDLLQRQNTLVSRYAQDSGYRYRKDLTEVFDLGNGNLKVGIPRRLFKGGLLIEDPAAIMEALLLEEAVNEDNANLCPLNGRVYSLEDLFNQDDFIEEDLMRNHHNARWAGRGARARAAAPVVASQPKTAPSNPCDPSSPSFRPYISSVDSQKLALQIMQNASVAASVSTAPVLTQQGVISQALSSPGSGLSSYLPMLQNYYAMAQRRAQDAVGSNTRLNQPQATSPPNLLPTLSPICSIPPTLPVSQSPREFKVEPIDSDDQSDAASLALEKNGGAQDATAEHALTGPAKAEHVVVTPRSSSAGDSGFADSMSPRSPVRSFCASELDVLSGALVIDQASPARSQSSDVSAETAVSSPRHDPDEVMTSPRDFASPPFVMFSGPCPVESGKSA